jgi:hypothetical protein
MKPIRDTWKIWQEFFAVYSFDQKGAYIAKACLVAMFLGFIPHVPWYAAMLISFVDHFIAIPRYHVTWYHKHYPQA